MGEPVIRLMEVCGTHTMAIAKAGIRQMLPAGVRLISGPGCPVCVTPPGTIDALLELSRRPGVIIATYGDMVRVPGSRRGTSLAREKAAGADVRVVYSAMDAVDLAEKEPDREVVFAGVGFETTAPGTAAAVKEAARRNLKNFSVWSMIKLLEPSVKALAADPEFAIDGFLAPGHVAVIIGEEGMRFFPEDLHLPAVITGFEPGEVARGITHLLRQVRVGEARLENEYKAVVRPEGNPAARALMDEIFEKRTDTWRGLGSIPASGLGIRKEYAAWDAQAKFGLCAPDVPMRTACRCGDVIRGRLEPGGCPLFGTVCTPEDPEGPCMVSSEGACAAAYKYRSV